MEEDLTLNEIELKLFLLKKRTEKAIKRNEATVLRLKRASQVRDAFLASLEGRPHPVLEDDSLYNASLGSSITKHSDPEPVFDSSLSGGSDERLTIDESRDDHYTSSDGGSSRSNEDERHRMDQDSISSSSYGSRSVITTASSTASRMQAFLQLAATEERRILARLDQLRSRLNSETDTVTAPRNGRKKS
jgi:hypothetical protein